MLQNGTRQILLKKMAPVELLVTSKHSSTNLIWWCHNSEKKTRL